MMTLQVEEEVTKPKFIRAPLRNSFRKLTKKFFVDTRRQKQSATGLREHFDNAVAAEKFESRTKWGFLEVPIIVCLVIALIGGCSRSPNRTGDSGPRAGEPVEERRVTVRAEAVRSGTFIVYGEYLGEARGILEVSLKADMEGQVARVFANEGDTVRVGQSLAEIDPEKVNRSYETAVLNERLALETFQREQRFLNEGNSFQLKVDQAHLAWLKSQSALLEAKRERDSALAITPISGTVVRRYIDPYGYLDSGDPTFDIADLRRIRITVDVPEADIMGVRELENAEVVFTAYPGHVFIGTPTGFARARSQRSLSYEVTVVVDNPDAVILSGQTARVRLALRQYPNTISVPSRAVLTRSDGSYVFVVRDGTAHEAFVKIGVASDTRTVIESGLFADDLVVTEGFNRLADGELIEIHN